MAEVKVSALTALTGANVANGDELYIVDTGSPNVSKKITADELAQMPQLSSRYKALASDSVWLSASDLFATQNTPALGTLGNASTFAARSVVMLYDSATSETAVGSFIMPSGWATFTTILWWSNASTGSGDVSWGVYVATLEDAESTDISPTPVTSVVTAPLQYVIKRSTLSGTSSATVGDFVRVAVTRNGNNAADTLGNDAGLLGVQLVRAS